jgi:GT2 family glycosyltransferase
VPASHSDASAAESFPDLATVSVVVPAAGDRESLQSVVEISAQDPATLEVIVVDDTANGDLPPLPLARIVRGRCLGPAAARQVGVEEARGDVVLLLDDDVVPETGLISAHRRHHLAAPGIVVVGTTPFVISAGTGADLIATRIHAQEYEERARRYRQGGQDPLPHLWGGNVSLRREDALAVGIYSDEFTLRYHEDRDFGLRLHAAGLRGVYDPALIAHHHYQRSFRQWLADAQARGAAEAALYRLHAETLGPVPDGSYARDLRFDARALVALVERPRSGRPMRWLLELLIRHGGRLHLGRVQLAAARVLRRVELRRGARTAGRPS